MFIGRREREQDALVLTTSFNTGVSNSNDLGADERPVWSVGGQIFFICWLAYHNTVDTTFECGKFTMCDQWYNG